MLSSVLRSRRAVQVNIMRTFVQLRRLMDFKRLIAEDEARKAQPKRRIGFTS